eukprot:9502810-Pyramimonas_sp.AAC.1
MQQSQLAHYSYTIVQCTRKTNPRAGPRLNGVLTDFLGPPLKRSRRASQPSADAHVAAAAEDNDDDAVCLCNIHIAQSFVSDAQSIIVTVPDTRLAGSCTRS